jgi:hypothetical protein
MSIKSRHTRHRAKAPVTPRNRPASTKKATRDVVARAPKSGKKRAK